MCGGGEGGHPLTSTLATKLPKLLAHTVFNGKSLQSILDGIRQERGLPSLGAMANKARLLWPEWPLLWRTAAGTGFDM